MMAGLGGGLVLLLAACGDNDGVPVVDQLSWMQQRGTVVIGVDPSVFTWGGARRSDTRCGPDQYTVGELRGFNPDVGAEIGARLGVETCYAVKQFARIVAGHWGGAFDVGVDSVTITTTRQQVLSFTAPYLYAAGQVAATPESGIRTLADLNGRTVCVGAGTIYQYWLQGDLSRLGLPPAQILAPPPTGVRVVTLPTFDGCGPLLAAGGVDFAAYASVSYVIDGDIAAGIPVVAVNGPFLSEHIAWALDRSSPLNGATLLTRLNDVVAAMHADGSLRALSIRWFGVDLTEPPEGEGVS